MTRFSVVGLGLIIVGFFSFVPCLGQSDEEKRQYIVSATAEIPLGDSWVVGERLTVKKIKWATDSNGKARMIGFGDYRFRRLATRKYLEISDTHLSRVEYKADPILGDQLLPGTVIGLQTSNGLYAKMRVTGYSVDGKQLSDKAEVTQAATLGHVNGKAAKLHVDWTLYTAKVGTTIVMASWLWDVDKNALGVGDKSDIWWTHEGDLQTQDDARFAIVDLPFRQLSPSSMKDVILDTKSIAKKDLTPGKVIALRTGDGNFAKLRVKGYRASRDFSFEGVELYPPAWRAQLEKDPNVDDFHIVFDWAIYPQAKGANKEKPDRGQAVLGLGELIAQ